MWNLAPRLNFTPDGQPPAKPPYTRVFKGRGELIDHIFASHRLVNPENIPEARTVVASNRLPSVNEVTQRAKIRPSIRPRSRGGDVHHLIKRLPSWQERE